MPKTVFGAGVRTVECPNCSAPIESPLQGGQFKCGYCGAVAMVTRRRVDARAPSRPAAEGGRVGHGPAADIARLSRLKAQVDHPVHGHAYDLERTPPGLEAAVAPTPQAEQLLSAAWSRFKSASGPPASLDEQLRICWVAVMLAEAYRRQREPLRTRAVLETALDLLDDGGHRHIIRCRLARQAVEAGDPRGAQTWLDECDAAPEVLELDGEYRLAAARVCLGQADAAGALRLLGAERGNVPVDPPHELAFATLRIAAHELSGQLSVALSHLQAAEIKFGEAAVRQRLAESNLAPRTMAHLHEQEARRQQEQAERRRLAAERAKRAQRAVRRVGCIFLGVIALGIAGAVTAVILWNRYRPFPMTCGRDDEMELEDRTETLNVDLIRAEPGCRLTIRNCDLRGSRVVVGSYNTWIRVEKSKLTGLSGVIEAGYDSTVIVHDKSTITSRSGAHDAIDIGWGGTVDIRDSTVESAGQLLDAGYNVKVTAHKSKLIVTSAPEYALKAQWGGEIRFTSALLQTKGGGMQLGYGNQVELKSSTLISGTAGSWLLDAGYNADIQTDRSRLESGTGGLNIEWGSKVSLSSDSSLTAKNNGINSKHRVHVVLDKSKLKSGEVGIATTNNSSVELKHKSAIEATVTGITATFNFKLRIDDSSIRAGHTGVAAQWDSRIDGRGARLEGKQRSFALGRDSVVDLQGSQLSGAQQLDRL